MDKKIVPIVIPGDMDNLALPDPELLNQYIDLEQRIIWISDDIDVYTLEVIKNILNWNRADRGKKVEDRKPIKLFFFTNGGMLDVYNSVSDVIEMSQTPVWGVNMGVCASAGAFIFLSCHKRYMLPSSYFLFHKGSIGFNGNAQDVMSLIRDYQEQLEFLVQNLVAKTNFTEEEMEEKIMSDFYVRAQMALDKGVVDEVVENIDLIL